MKKVTVCAMIAAMTVTGAAAIPVQAATNAGNSANCNGKGYYVFTGGKVSDLENIKSRLDELCGQLNGNTATITFPGCNLPENKPETTPPSEDTNTPESKPETTPPSEDANTPENKPEADKELTFAEQVDRTGKSGADKGRFKCCYVRSEHCIRSTCPGERD